MVKQPLRHSHINYEVLLDFLRTEFASEYLSRVLVVTLNSQQLNFLAQKLFVLWF